jgi:hypothetical protein
MSKIERTLELALNRAVDKCAAALEIASTYGQVEGDHHKAWVIDQMVRALTGESYELWVQIYQMPTDPDALFENEWETGIAP